MSTRAQIRFATREQGVSFNDHPQKIHAQFYCHYDGYPEGLGVEIAECFTKYGKIYNWEIEELSMYDFIMGCSMVFETMPSKANNKIIDEFHKGLGWFAKNNPSAYMTLLD